MQLIQSSLNFLSSTFQAAGQMLGETVREVTPTIISRVIELGIRDERVMRIVTGISAVYFGTYCLKVVYDDIKCRTWKKNPSIQSSPNACARVQTLANLALKATCIGMSIFWISCGITTIADSHIDIMHLRDSQGLLLRIDSAGVPLPQCDQPEAWSLRAQEIREAISYCPAAKELGRNVTEYQKSKKFPDWSLKIVPHEEAPFGATVYRKSGQIMISCANTGPVVDSIFELGNLNNREFDKVDFLARSGVYARYYQNPDEAYAIEMEIAELETTKEHGKIMHQCSGEVGWKLKFSSEEFSVEDSLAALKKSGHTEGYRRNYEEKLGSSCRSR